MSSSPQEPSPGKEESVEPTGFRPTHTAWSVLSSPWTLAISVMLLALLFVSSASIAQGTGFRSLLDAMTFSQARVLEGVGATHLWTSWVAVVLSVVAALSTLGTLLRLTSSALSSEPLAGVLVSRSEITLNITLEAATARLAPLKLGAPRPLGPEAGLAFGVRWPLRASALLLGLGLLTFAGTQWSLGSQSEEVEVSHLPMRPEIEATTRVLEAGEWVEKKVGFSLMCAAPDPLSVDRAHDCLFRFEGDTYRLDDLGPEPIRAGLAHTIQLLHETAVPTLPIMDKGGNFTGKIPIHLRLKGPSDQSLRGMSGDRLSLDDGRQIELTATSDGPLVVVHTPGETPAVLVPMASTTRPDRRPSDRLSALPDWRLTARVTRDPGETYRLLAWALVALALLVWLLWPHVRVIVRPIDAHTLQVVVFSLNRPGLPSRLVEKLKESSAS